MYFSRSKRLVLLVNIFALFWLAAAFGEEISGAKGIQETKDVKEAKQMPMIVNGDNVEYSADSRSVSAAGKVEVIFRGSKLTCNKLTVNMDTKEAVAQGNARLDDKMGVVEGEKLIYNFQDKTGIILDARFRANPYFGRAKKVEKIGDTEFAVKDGYFTTCNLDHPHFRFNSKKISLFPGDKIQSQGTTLYLGAVPVVYLPRFNYSMKKPIMHVQVEPGKSKDWGPYLLTTWRYNLNENVNARVYLDYRKKLGLAEGFSLNYNTLNFGRGDYKFYYTKEKPDNLPQGQTPTEFTRYFMRLRHKWDIDERTNFTAEFLKITDKRRKKDPSYPSDRSFLQDYFFREYEKDTQPLSYALFHHAFNYSSTDIIFQKRTNHWFSQIEKLPEVNYNLPNIQVGDTPFYFEDSSQLGNYNNIATAPNDNLTVFRIDTNNKVSLPMKIAFFKVNPFLQSRQTFYDKGENGETGIVRTIFYSGADISTKFYRVFDVKSNFLGMDINGLRHIITPSIAYLYTHTPTIPPGNIRQIDGVDSIIRGDTATLVLDNKLQTKRNGNSIDLLDLQVTTDYVIKPKTGQNSILTNTGNKLRSGYSDINFKLVFLPYSWMRMEGESTFEHSDHDNINYGRFSLANYSLYFDLSKGRTFNIGQRYERKGKNEVTAGFDWQFSPKWKFSVYERYNFKQSTSLKRGIQEQQYTLTRDLHCWSVEMSFNKQKGKGSSIYFTFRLKAFPENEFGFDQTISRTKSGAQ